MPLSPSNIFSMAILTLSVGAATAGAILALLLGSSKIPKGDRCRITVS
jgi:hypothetical protein